VRAQQRWREIEHLLVERVLSTCSCDAHVFEEIGSGALLERLVDTAQASWALLAEEVTMSSMDRAVNNEIDELANVADSLGRRSKGYGVRVNSELFGGRLIYREPCGSRVSTDAVDAHIVQL
jgi:hypothetical protein